VSARGNRICCQGIGAVARGAATKARRRINVRFQTCGVSKRDFEFSVFMLLSYSVLRLEDKALQECNLSAQLCCGSRQLCIEHASANHGQSECEMGMMFCGCAKPLPEVPILTSSLPP